MTEPNLNTFSPDAQHTPVGEFSLPSLGKTNSVIVVGAGAFGGWTALHLLRKGFAVTLIDAWGAGNSRSSSGDETRVIRSTYGANETYFDMNVRALSLWKENQERFGKQLFFPSGVLWMCYDEQTPVVDDSIPFAEKHNVPYEHLSREAMVKRFPHIHTGDLDHAFYDPYGGYLKARESCYAVWEAFQREGGTYIQGNVNPGSINAGKLERITLSDGSYLRADAYVFACGSWMGRMFPDIIGNMITCTKQEVYYFGVPSSHTRAFDNMPVWIDVDGKDFYYGIPGNVNRGFKIGVDVRGESFDPTNGERVADPNALKKAREFIAHRFPPLRDAPLLENRVCPYENSPDGNFIVDVHPEANNIVLVGGGSGHGFKHGPALGELVASALNGEKKIPGLFALNRFKV